MQHNDGARGGEVHAAGFREHGREVGVVGFDDGAGAEETEDAGAGVEGVEEDSDAAVFIEVGDGFGAAAGEVDVGGGGGREDGEGAVEDAFGRDVNLGRVSEQMFGGGKRTNVLAGERAGGGPEYPLLKTPFGERFVKVGIEFWHAERWRLLVNGGKGRPTVSCTDSIKEAQQRGGNGGYRTRRGLYLGVSGAWV